MFIVTLPANVLRLLCFTIGLPLSLLAGLSLSADAQTARTPATGSLKVITGQPGSVVYINNIKHGVTGDGGTLDLPRVKAGIYTARVRTVGFVDWKGPVVVAARAGRTLKVTQKPATDKATLHYQRGDQLRDRANHKEAVKEYAEALALRPAFPEARVAYARSLIVLDIFDEAEKQLKAALREHRGPYAEAQTVLANMRRAQGLIDEAIEEYEKALKISRGQSPEAHIGLALALQEAGEMDEAIREFRIGIAQDMDTEPILYYLLGEALAKEKRYKEAIEAYSGYLRLDPDGQYSSAVESIIEQLKAESDGQI